MTDIPQARHTTPEVREVLHWLGIGLSEPWIWLKSDGPIERIDPEPFLQVEAPEGVPTTLPQPYAISDRWIGYRIDIVGKLVDPKNPDHSYEECGAFEVWPGAGKTSAGNRSGLTFTTSGSNTGTRCCTPRSARAGRP